MQHSASSITLAERCDRAWWLRYREGLKQPELSWLKVKRMRARGEQLPAGAYSKALGKEMHRLAELWLYLPPRKSERQIDWNDLPGQCLAEIVPYLPAAGSVSRRDVEARLSLVVAGVRFRGLIDVVGRALGKRVSEVYDHKTTRDIREYALLPDAVAKQLNQPKRSLLNDLQACLYVLSQAARVSAAGGLARWNYSETQRSRRALPVVQYIPTVHAERVAHAAAEVARRVEAFGSIEDATPNTLACDQYGGCWYRHEGHCRVPRKWGAVFMNAEREEKERSTDMGKLNFKALGVATAKANAAEETKAVKQAKPTKAAPPPEPEETDEEEQDDDEEEAPESEPAPKASKRMAKKAGKRAAKAVEPEDNEDDDSDEEPESEPAKPATAREQFNAATSAPDTVLQFFKTDGLKGEAKIIATAFAELADHLGANLPRNPFRAQCLRGLLLNRDDAVRALEYKDS